MTTLLERRYPSHLHRPHLRAINSVDPSLVQATWAASQEVDDPISRPRGGWWSVSDWATATRPLVDDGEVIGLAAVHAGRGDEVAEGRLALLPDRRTRGAARSLVDAALRVAREAGAERLRLVVPRAADWAAEAARRAGFEPIRETYVMLRPMSAGPLAPPAEHAVRVRPLRPDEEPALLAALNRAWAGTWGFGPIPPAALAGDLRGQPDGMLVAVDAEDDARIVATVHAIFDPDARNTDGGPYAWISNLTTDPNWRGRGLGKLMLGQGVRSLRERGAESAMLGVDAGNAAAVGLYRSSGFGVVGMTDIWERPLRGPA
jgi:mycothiol synthase